MNYPAKRADMLLAIDAAEQRAQQTVQERTE